MIERQAMDAKGRVKVTFVLAEGGIDGQVAVVGDFNGWDPTAAPLRKRGGRRVASVFLLPGRRYAFRYLGEGGQWFNDDAADDYEPNEYGGSDSVVDLSERP
ncbi:MAG: isoamylase early set domain-containing protein [Actinomycetota bacterium]|nr:isoamylase early set domain-containing protein [Actinomycetota bacterium]